MRQVATDTSKPILGSRHEPLSAGQRYIGNRGTGPGEFSYLYRTGFAGDTLWVQDMFAARTSFFDPAGVHIMTEANTGQPEMGSGYARKMPLSVLTRVYPRTDSYGVASVLESTTMEIEGVGSFAHQLVRPPPLYVRAPDGSGLVVVDWAIDLPDRVTVRRYGLDGRLTAESTLDFELREIPADVREAIPYIVLYEVGPARGD